MIGFVDRKESIDRLKLLLDTYGEDFTNSIDCDISEDFDMNNVDITIRLNIRIPFHKKYTESLAKIMYGD